MVERSATHQVFSWQRKVHRVQTVFWASLTTRQSFSSSKSWNIRTLSLELGLSFKNSIFEGKCAAFRSKGGEGREIDLAKPEADGPVKYVRKSFR
jgi:hypothetical protein